MSSKRVKILFLSDTHLGFDSTQNPKVERRRRGDDFYNNFLEALKPAFENNVDLVVHGGDLFYRSKIPESLIDIAFEPIMKVAESGIPFLIVPGNHERSFVPCTLFHTHPNLYLFDSPQTLNFNLKNISVSFSGFPFLRDNIRDNFIRLMNETGYSNTNSDFNFLCVHHAIEGATVGIQNFTFQKGEDVIRASDIPGGFAAVLSGHIHRAQVLDKDLKGNKLNSIVIYPGSIERTSFVERNEQKGYYILDLQISENIKSFRYSFVELYTRPMYVIEIDTAELVEAGLKELLIEKTKALEPDSIIQIKLKGVKFFSGITAKYLRSIIPATANISLSIPGLTGYNENG